jgi:hypothetical protein
VVETDDNVSPARAMGSIFIAMCGQQSHSASSDVRYLSLAGAHPKAPFRFYRRRRKPFVRSLGRIVLIQAVAGPGEIGRGDFYALMQGLDWSADIR